MTDETRHLPTEFERKESLAPQTLLALAVVWAAGEPERLGEVLLVPLQKPSDGNYLFGRHDPSDAHNRQRLVLVRQRPGTNAPMGAPVSPYLSRTQLELLADGSALRVQNVGRLPMKVNGTTMSETLIRPGDVIELKRQLLLLCVQRSQQLPSSRGNLRFPRFGGPDSYGMVGESEVMWRLRQEIITKSRRRKHLIVFGPSGSGKEHVATAVALASGHDNFVAAAAPDIPEALIEAELFGNLANYPHHGLPARPGLIGQANGTTLILDEFGELKQELQTRLLRVMATGEYHCLGKATPDRSSFRLVAATNRPKRFLRHDILARFKDQIQLPDLNERREDIPLLATYLLRKLAEDDPEIKERFFESTPSGDWPRTSAELMSFLVRFPYSTNVRQLETLLLRAIDASPGKQIIMPPAFNEELEEQPPGSDPDVIVPKEVHSPTEQTLEHLLDDTDLEHLRQFRLAHFSPSRAASLPGFQLGRASAENYILLLIFVAIRHTDWQVTKAAEVLAGPDALHLIPTLDKKIKDVVANLCRRIEEEGVQRATEKLRRQFRARFEPTVAPVLKAIQDRLLK